MRRKPVLMAIGIIFLVLATVLFTLALLARHEPGFYVRAAVPPGEQRQQLSSQFYKEFMKLRNGIVNKDPKWYATFTEAQINSFFEEDCVAQNMLPEGVTAPRVAIEKDRIRLAFRYGTPPWCTIISIDFRVWLAPKEPNVVVLELQGLHAGALPVSAHSLLEELSEVVRRRNIEVNWYRHQGNPTAVLRFQSDQARASVQLRQLELRPGMITVAGRSLDPLPRTSMAKTVLPTP
jgi:hypothetical protein